MSDSVATEPTKIINKNDDGWKPPKRKFNFRKWLYRLEDGFETASSVADTLHKCFKEPSVWNIAKTAFDFAHQAQQLFMVNYHDRFNGWMSPYTEDYNYAIVEVLKHLPYDEEMTNDENLSLRKVLVPLGKNQFEMYYAMNIENESIEGVHVKPEDLELARAFIKEAFWREFDQQFLLMRNKKVFRHGQEIGEFLVFENDDEIEPIMSGKAQKIADKTRKFLAADINRSILLYGPPGTGKSTMVRAIVRNLGLKSLRIRVEDLEDLSNTTIFEAVKIFEPQCIIVDDLDRANRLTHLLEMLERFNKKLKVVFATVNDKDSLGDAILRPGRFDELIEIKDLEEETIRRILGSDDEEVFDVVKGWPVAYTLEFVKRRTYMSREEALESLAELHHRVQCLEGYADDDEKAPPTYQQLLAKARANRPNKSLSSEVIEEISKKATKMAKVRAKKKPKAKKVSNLVTISAEVSADDPAPWSAQDEDNN